MRTVRILLLVGMAAAATSSHPATSSLVGERLRYDVRWGALLAGHATIDLLPDLTAGWATVRTVAWANDMIQPIYPVHDTVTSRIDLSTGFPSHFRKRLIEGSYRALFTTRFDRANSKAHVTSRVGNQRFPDTTITVPQQVHDILSAFLAVRTQPLEPGRSDTMPIIDNRRLFPRVEIRVHGRAPCAVPGERPSTCLVIEPLLHADALFRARGTLRIWLTDDHRRLPVLMTSRIRLGTIRAELVQFERHAVR